MNLFLNIDVTLEIMKAISKRTCVRELPDLIILKLDLDLDDDDDVELDYDGDDPSIYRDGYVETGLSKLIERIPRVRIEEIDDISTICALRTTCKDAYISLDVLRKTFDFDFGRSYYHQLILFNHELWTEGLRRITLNIDFMDRLKRSVTRLCCSMSFIGTIFLLQRIQNRGLSPIEKKMRKHYGTQILKRGFIRTLLSDPDTWITQRNPRSRIAYQV